MIYGISNKTFMGGKALCIRLDKADGFIKISDETIYLVLFGSEEYDAIYNGIRYLMSVKSGITENINYNFARIRIYSYNYLLTEKTLTFHDVIIFIR